jgi:hypothetical protein
MARDISSRIATPQGDRNDHFLLLVGKLNYTWSNTESLLIYVIMHLMGTSKAAAVVTFLSLNTTRARLEFIDRLLKIDGTEPAIRRSVSEITTRMKSVQRVRNKFNHCIYAFDKNGTLESTQLLRIADYGDALRYGKVEPLDDREAARIGEALTEIAQINRAVQGFLSAYGISVH